MLPNIDTGQIWLDCLNFLPELLACGGIVLFLLLRLFDRSHMGTIALLVTALALGVSVAQWSYLGSPQTGDSGFHGILRPAFGGLLVYDHVTIFLRCFLYGFTAFIIWLSLTTGIPDREDSADFYCLLLGATVGMVIMASATHLLMVYIGIEMASLPSYALAGYLKGRRQSSEAALKYVVYGGGAAGVMLYGISLLAGRFGTGYLPDIAAGLVTALSAPGAAFDPVLILAVLFILIGVAFKLAAVPFHFWCPDVFEGASAEVAGYLSVASKGAALALLARLILILGGIDPIVQPVVNVHWEVIVRYLVPALAFFAALTATFGNLAAYLQNNLKRLLAYSTIAHAGYMMMGLAALKPIAGKTSEFDPVGLQAVLFYLIAYLFMNLGAFAVVAFLRNQTGSEDLDDYRGLVRRSPWMVVTLSIFLLSLLGLPPLVGFTAKFQIFAALWDASQGWYACGDAGLGATLFGLLVIGGVNSVVSAVYYIKVMKVMILEGRAEDLEGREPVHLPEPLSAVAFSAIVALLVLVLGILWAPLDKYSHQGADRFAERTDADPRSKMGGGGWRRTTGDGPAAGTRWCAARSAGATTGCRERKMTVIDPQTQTLLQDILRRESRSVLRYVTEAFPWINSTEEKALAAVQQILAAEREAVVGLGQFLVRHRVMLPFLPSYPASFTTINFLALDYVLPLLVEYERQSIAELERDLASLKDQAARAEVEKLLAVKQRHLPELEALIPSQSQASLI